MSNAINQALIRVASKNPEFRKALIAELKKSAVEREAADELQGKAITAWKEKEGGYGRYVVLFDASPKTMLIALQEDGEWTVQIGPRSINDSQFRSKYLPISYKAIPGEVRRRMTPLAKRIR